MGSSVSTAAIFDLDGTLFDGHVWFAVVQHHKTRRINRRWLYIYLAVHMPLWYLYKLRLISGERMRYFWTRNMSWTLRGFDQAQAKALFDWVTDEFIVPRLRSEVVECLRHHQAQGHRVVLLSGSFEGLLATVGQRLGIDDVLGTQLRQHDGRYVGSSILPICQGRGKAVRLRDYCVRTGQDIDLDASYAYADSITDLPVLEAVGHPVAVCPDEELAVLAHQRGWSIIGNTYQD
jgi:fatty acyl-CoA reductase